MSIAECIGVVMLVAGISTATLEHTVENFQVDSLDDTHVTFSWDIARDVRRSIQSFDIYYTYAYPGYVSTSYNRADGRVTIAVENAHYDPNSDNSQLKYNFTTAVTSFNNRAQYIMWLEVRRTRNRPSLLSQQIYVEVGSMTAFEMSIALKSGQNCNDFTVFNILDPDVIASEVYRALRIHCKCTYDFIRHVSIVGGYFECHTQGHVTYRAYVSLADSTVAHNLSTIVEMLRTWLTGKNNTITIRSRKYTVSPGHCGLTVPHTSAPFCGASAVSGIMQASNMQFQTDNSAIIIASVFAGMFFILAIGLIVCIIIIIRITRKPSQTLRSPTEVAAPPTNPYLAPSSIPAPVQPPNKPPPQQPPPEHDDSQIYEETN